MLALAHRRVLVTRAAGQASVLATQLEALGARCILIPTIELAPPVSYCAMDAALASIRSFDWVVLTSANAAYAFAERARSLGIAAIGPATARAVVESGLGSEVELMPTVSVAESLAEALLPHAEGASMLLVRAAVARDILPEMLTAAGALVTIAEAYRSVIPAESVAALTTLFRDQAPDAITFTSASTARNLVALLEAGSLKVPEGIVLASIGPVTSAAMRELGLEPTVEAREAGVGSLVEALAEKFGGSR
jgi:uroporphyrinogen-III synthase